MNIKMKFKTLKNIHITGIAILVIAFLLLATIYVFKSSRVNAEIAHRNEEMSKGLRVQASSVRMSSSEHVIHVPGDARPYANATLFAKVSGYLKEMKVDKGDLVKEGDLIAVIDSPETTMNYVGALADAKNKRAIANRMRPLHKKKLVSDQEAEQAYSEADIAEAKLESLKALKAYETIKAPFNGIITARYADPGALVQDATNSQTSALALVSISRIDRLRVYVYLDQKSAVNVKVGDLAEITVAEKPDIKVSAPVSRISGELDARTRTMLVEIDVDNARGWLVSNSYVQVALKIKMDPSIEVPIEAIVTRDQKSFVPLIQSDNTVKYVEVVLGDNDGVHCQVRSGLQVGNRVALNLGNNLVDGQKVQVVEEQKDLSHK